MNIIEFKGLGLTFFINPIAFTIFKLTVHWYGIIIALGFLTGFIVLMYNANREKYDIEVLTDLVIICTPAAIIGARLYYVIFKFSDYKDNLIDVFKVWEGGLAIYGAIIAVIITVFTYCKIKKLNTMQIADLAAPGFIIAQAIGRWGNFVNQEAYGRETTLPWAMTIIQNGIPISVHPTFLYESLINLTIFIVLMFYYKHKKFNGEIFWIYIGLYSFGRFFIEGLRTDSLYLGSLRISQIVATIFVVFSAIMIAKFRKKTIYKEY